MTLLFFNVVYPVACSGAANRRRIACLSVLFWSCLSAPSPPPPELWVSRAKIWLKWYYDSVTETFLFCIHSGIETAFHHTSVCTNKNNQYSWRNLKAPGEHGLTRTQRRWSGCLCHLWGQLCQSQEPRSCGSHWHSKCNSKHSKPPSWGWSRADVLSRAEGPQAGRALDCTNENPF